EDWPGGNERPHHHQGTASPCAAHRHALPEGLADDDVAKGDGEEGGEDDGVDHAVRRQALVVIDAEEADVLDEPRAIEHLQDAVVDAEDQEREGQEHLDQHHGAQVLLDHGVTSISPTMSWCESPQSAWQMTCYLPGASKRACA